MNNYLNGILAILALINPLSKLFVVHTMSQSVERSALRHIVIKASLIAGSILIIFTVTGNFLLKYLFRVDIYSFQIIGGIVLAFRGLQALNRGLFFEVETNQKLEDVSIVPLASPMIAGPATITAAISFPDHYGMIPTLLAIICAVSLNLFFMLHTYTVSHLMTRFNLMGALIRITGLVVATIGVQMMLNGIAAYIATL